MRPPGYAKEQYLRHRDKRLASAKQRYKENPKKCTDSSKRKYRERRDALITAQQGRCACCGACNPGHKHGWQVHHIHMPGTGYAVLCAKCNRGSSGFRDDPILLRRMANINESLTPRG